MANIWPQLKFIQIQLSLTRPKFDWIWLIRPQTKFDWVCLVELSWTTSGAKILTNSIYSTKVKFGQSSMTKFWSKFDQIRELALTKSWLNFVTSTSSKIRLNSGDSTTTKFGKSTPTKISGELALTNIQPYSNLLNLWHDASQPSAWPSLSWISAWIGSS